MITLRTILYDLHQDSLKSLGIGNLSSDNLSLVDNPLFKAYQQLMQQTHVLDRPFADFVLDSRKLKDNDVLILLKSQTQPIQKSREYLHSVKSQACFIITEIPLSELGDDINNYVDDTADNQSDCPVISIPNIRSILGSLIQTAHAISSVHHESVNADISTDINADMNADMNADKTDSNSVVAVNPLPCVIAVTGTNGKTTISQLVAQLCQNAQTLNADVAIMGTAGNGKLDNLEQASHTTGDALAVQTFLRHMADEHVNILALEASSHGLDQQRLQGVPIKVAIYTNLSRDHLDYHPTMEDYARAKARLFDRQYFPTLTHAIINIDDEFAPLMLQTAADSGLEVWTYTINVNKTATFKAQQTTPSLDGVEIELVTDFGTVWLNSPLLGRFNVANLLGAIAGAMAMGVKLAQIPALVAQLKGADGRMQRVLPPRLSGKQNKTDNETADNASNRGSFIVDYAHTPDALTQVLNSLRPHCDGQLWAVFGCGGDRDSGKRPLMVQAGLAGADRVILTSDNPRSEDPDKILADMTQGMSASQQDKTVIIPDRRQAIEYAVAHASDKDIVVIAGKGHETYQEVNGVRYDFDDRVVLREALANAD